MRNSRRRLWALLPAALVLCGMLVAAHGAGGDGAVDDYNFAAWLYNNGKYDVAVGSYEAFLKNYAEHEKAADARFGLAQSLFHLNRFDEAVTIYDALRREKPDFSQMAEVLFQLGQCCVAQKDFARAEGLFAEVRTSYPDHYLVDWAAARQAACLLSLEKVDEAAVLLQEFVGRYAPDRQPPEKSEATRQAFTRMEEAGVNAQSAFLALIERSVFYLAIAKFNAGKFREARPGFEHFLALYPASDLDTEARFRLAQCLYRTDQFGAAAAAYAPVADGDSPFAATAAYERGLALYKEGKLKDASALLAKMAERFPGDENAARAALHAGTFLYEAGEFGAAAERLRPRVGASLPLADEAAYWLGMSLLKGGKPAEAEPVLAHAIKEHPASGLAADMQLGLADARLAQENLVGAAEAFTDYAARFGKSEAAPQALYSACVALHRAGKYEESDARCAGFLKSYKDHALASQVLFLSAENQFLLKQYEAAAARYRDFLEREKESPDRLARAHFRLAWCHRHGRRFAEALAELDKADLKAAGPAIASEALYVRGACLFDLEKYADAEKAMAAYLKASDHSLFGDDAILKMSVAQSRQGDKAGAVAGFERFLSEYPRSELAGQTRYQLAESYYDLKRYDKAVRGYRDVLASQEAAPLHPFALFGLGQCAYDQGDWKEAAKQFGELAEKHAKSELRPQALYRRGLALMKESRWEEAEAPLLALTAAYPKHELARAAWGAIGNGRQKRAAWDLAAAAFSEALKAGGPGEDQPRLLYELAWSRREAGQEAESLQAFRDLVKAFPTDALAADAKFHLAEACYKEAGGPAATASNADSRRLLQEAAALYAGVLELTQDVRLGDKACYRLGWCRWSLGEYPEAAASFDLLVDRYPRSELAPDALFQAGQALALAGKIADANSRYEKLIGDAAYAGFAYMPEAYVAMGDGLLSTGKAEEALPVLRQAVAKGGEEASATRAHFLIGKALYQLGKYEEAIQSFGAVTKRTRGVLAAEAQFYIGQVHQAREQFDQAIVDYLRVQALYAAYPEWVGGATLEMGTCHEALGRADEAQKAYRAVAEEFKDSRWAALARERVK